MTICPTFASWEEFRAHRFDGALWRQLVYDVLTRHRIAGPARVTASSVHVVEVAGLTWAVESAAIRLLSRNGLPVPTLLAAGVLFPQAVRFRWPYSVMSALAGRPLDEWTTTAAERQRIARSWAGDEPGRSLGRAGGNGSG